MTNRTIWLRAAVLGLLAGAATAQEAEDPAWWNPQWQFRTTVTGATPDRDAAERPVEVAVDFQRLLQNAGIAGQPDLGSVRVIGRGSGAEMPVACRTEFHAAGNRQELYLAWLAPPQPGRCGVYDWNYAPWYNPF